MGWSFFVTLVQNKSLDMNIPELPDYKAYRSEIDKYIDEPLLEYVWTVADAFIPVVDQDGRSESQAPVIFANRCIESTLTNPEKYARFLEFFPSENIESAQRYYAERNELNTTFKEKFFSKVEVIKTLNAFRLDLDKFWYLLLFITDLVEDVCSNAPTREPSEADKINEMIQRISEATEIVTKKNGRQNYESNDEFTLSILKASIDYFIKTYNDILTLDNSNEVKAKLHELGLGGKIRHLVAIQYDEKVALEKSHKTRLFAAMFQYFLKDKEVDRERTLDFTRKDSTDKLLLISRLSHIVGLQGEEYYERHILNEKGRYVANRKLSNLLSRYRDEPLPPTLGWIYSGGL